MISGAGRENIREGLAYIFLFLIVFATTYMDLIYVVLGLESGKYLDDVVLLMIYIFLLANVKFIFAHRVLVKLAVLLSLMLVIGCLQYFYAKYATPQRLLLGMIYFFKPVAYMFAGIVFSSRVCIIDSKYYIRIALYVLGFGFLLCLANLVFPSAWRSIIGSTVFNEGYRLTGPFPNAGRTSWLLASCFVILVWFWGSRRKNILLYVGGLFCLYMLSLTFVKKSMLSALAGAVTIIFKRSSKIRYGVLLVVALLFVPLMTFLVERMLLEYNLTTVFDNPRYLLFLGSILILVENHVYLFFGGGYGSWGGYVSSFIYSPYYEDFGFDTMWGFLPGESSYTGDNYFAHVFGEVGLLGGVLWFYILILIVRLPSVLLRVCSVPERLKSRLKLFQALVLVLYVESLGISSLEISSVSFLVIFIYGSLIGRCLNLK